MTETTGTADPVPSRARYMLIFRGGAVSRDDVSPSVLQAHVEKWYPTYEFGGSVEVRPVQDEG